MRYRRRLYRRRDTAEVLTVSESQTFKYERQGLLTPIYLPGIRAVRFDAAEVDRLAERFIAEGKRPRAEAAGR